MEEQERHNIGETRHVLGYVCVCVVCKGVCVWPAAAHSISITHKHTPQVLLSVAELLLLPLLLLLAPFLPPTYPQQPS